MIVTPLHTQHSRRFEENRFVYPVLSRRSEGISVGVNMNPDKVCNYDCIYCQVDRTTQSETRFVEFAQLLEELEDTLRLAASGELFEHPQFKDTPQLFRRLNDIAFSGDGEPTTYRNFDESLRDYLKKHEPGLSITAETARCQWHGESMDYSHAIESMQFLEHKVRAPRLPQNEARPVNETTVASNSAGSTGFVTCA